MNERMMTRLLMGFLFIFVSACQEIPSPVHTAPVESKWVGTDPAMDSLVESKAGEEGVENNDAHFDMCIDGPNKNFTPQGEVAEKVYYGTALPTFLPLTPEQIWAIGWMHSCSGLLIKPRWVLSASHCNFLWEGGEFCMGPDPDNPNHCIDIESAYDHPWADLAVLKLAEDARLVLPGVTPIPLLTEDLDNSWIGKTAEAAGYGTQETGYIGEREFTAEPIAYMGNSTVTIYGEGKHGVCFGDSGGPMMVIASDGSVRTAGALSNGDSSCVGYDNYTRVDVFRDWIEGYTGATVPPEPIDCGETDVFGSCHNSNQAHYCGEDGKLVIDLCDVGETCSWAKNNAGWRCVSEENDACNGVSTWGKCDNEVLTWCGLGGLLTRDCGACDEVCVLNDNTGFQCVKSQCGDLGYHGKCDGSVLTWCNEQGEIETYDCGSIGNGCGWQNDDKGYNCVDNTCGDLDYLGQCNGNVAEWCDGNGKIRTVNCANHDQVCGWVGDEKGYYCMSEPCGDVDYFGQCNGDTAIWCKEGKLKEKDCNASGQSCGLYDDETGFFCLPEACGELDFYGYCDGNTVRWCNRDGEPDALDCSLSDQSCDLLSESSGYYCVD